MKHILRMFALVCLFFACILSAMATNNQASAEMSFVIPKYLKIIPITSPVLIANITDRTGNLYAPLHARFRVISNSGVKETLYLQANSTTDAGFESAMFMQGGQVYIAFTNLQKVPSSSAFANCKMGAMPKDSPGVVAYPITSITGADHKYISGKNKYEVYIKNNGTTDINVNVGSSVLRSSFAGNDPKGFYQTVLSLTEVDI